MPDPAENVAAKQPRWAPDNAKGQHPYVVTTTTWARPYSRIEYASDLAEAKRRFGWTRQMHTTVRVRRAKPEDMKATNIARPHNESSAPSPTGS